MPRHRFVRLSALSVDFVPLLPLFATVATIPVNLPLQLYSPLMEQDRRENITELVSNTVADLKHGHRAYRSSLATLHIVLVS